MPATRGRPDAPLIPSQVGTNAPPDSSAELVASDASVQVPGIYRWWVGSLVVTAIADGYADIPLAMVPDATPEAADALARAAFVSPGDLQCVINTFAIRTPSSLVLVDTGFGAGGGPHSGKIWRNLAAAGISPEDVDVLVITHGHPDHTSGMLSADGSAAFPNAELFVHAAEKAFWCDDANMTRAPEFQKPWFAQFRTSMADYGERTTFFDRDDQQIVPGVRVRELFGHTPGHSGLHLSEGGEQTLLWTDIVHFQHLQFPKPRWGVGFDVDAERAATTRGTVLDMAAADGVAVAGTHLVFPGYGHVRRDGHGAYAFEPARWVYAPTRATRQAQR